MSIFGKDTFVCSRVELIIRLSRKIKSRKQACDDFIVRQCESSTEVVLTKMSTSTILWQEACRKAMKSYTQAQNVPIKSA